MEPRTAILMLSRKLQGTLTVHVLTASQLKICFHVISQSILLKRNIHFAWIFGYSHIHARATHLNLGNLSRLGDLKCS